MQQRARLKVFLFYFLLKGFCFFPSLFYLFEGVEQSGSKDMFVKGLL